MSRESEKLYDGVTNIDDAIIERVQAARPKHRRFYRKWMGPVAAVLAIAILANVLLRGDLISSAYAIERAEYPERSFAGDLAPGDGIAQFFAAGTPRFLAGASGENRVYSPLAAYIALAMTAELTDGESRAQIMNLLGEEDLSALRKQAHELWNDNYYDVDEGKSILASSLWMSDEINYVRPTLQTLAENYYASSFSGKMGSPLYNAALQSWLNGQTHGMLERSASGEKMEPDTVLALVSTVYFRAKWHHKFDKSATAPDTFRAPGGDMTCDFMHQRMSGDYYWFDHFAAVQQTCKTGASMWYILPDEGVTPEEVLRDPAFAAFLTGDKRDLENSKYLYVNLAVPKFDISCELDMAETFQALGVTDIFDYTISDFTPLTTDPKLDDMGVYLTDAKQAARVTIDEDGCEATTYIKLNFGAGAAAPPTDEIDFALDRPFLFAITNTWRGSNLPLFVGVVEQP